jgi:polysaccharide export outer membrane protein
MAGGLAGCTSFLAASGPSRVEVARKQAVQDAGIQLVAVDDVVAKRLLDREQSETLTTLEAGCQNGEQRVGPGDMISIGIWESPPAALFGPNTAIASGTGQTSSAPVALPEQQITRDGTITVPFAGLIRVGGLTTKQIESAIYDRLKGKANDPQVMVRLVKNVSSTVTVVGEVTNTVMPLTPKCERLLDVLATAGVKQQTNKLTVQLTRGEGIRAVPFDVLIRDARENIHVQAGDVVTVLYQPLSFTALGATGKNAEVEFEAKGITLAQALARAGGLVDARADTQGVFVFRYEAKDAMPWPGEHVLVTPDGKVPVIYTVNLRDPKTFFAAQSFPVKDKDVLYVSNAPAAQLQKFMTLVGSLVNPVLTTTTRVQAISN